MHSILHFLGYWHSISIHLYVLRLFNYCCDKLLSEMTYERHSCLENIIMKAFDSYFNKIKHVTDGHLFMNKFPKRLILPLTSALAHQQMTWCLSLQKLHVNFEYLRAQLWLFVIKTPFWSTTAGGQNNINDPLKMTRPSPVLGSTSGHEAKLIQTIVEGLLLQNLNIQALIQGLKNCWTVDKK